MMNLLTRPAGLCLALVAVLAICDVALARIVFVPRVFLFDGVPTIRMVPRYVPDPAPTVRPDAAEAARFLTQASFGPTVESIASVRALGFDGWLDRQFDLLEPPQLNYYYDVPHGYSASNDQGRHEVWWRDVVEGEDQLRQRVAFALSQILVVSDVGRPLSIAQIGMTNYYDLLRENAFGNYRDLLELVTLSPVMGTFLSTAGNERQDESENIRPDENYAREVLQLFSIGPFQLELDGSLVVDGTGRPVPTYSEATVKAFARVFTGWENPALAYWRQTSEDINSLEPMAAYPEFHDDGAKTLLDGQVTTAGLSQAQDLQVALDNIFAHPNVGPFISQQLIQRLVTSTPTPGYVRRIATVFNDNGSGVRGDLRAVVRAILLDREARRGHIDIAGFGKLKEPVLRLSHIWRAFDIQAPNSSAHGAYSTESPQLSDLSSVTGQAVLSASSVFNFYHPNYSPAGPVRDAGLLGPEFEIATDNNILATTNRIDRQVQYFARGANPYSENRAFLDLSTELGLAGDVDALLDHLDILLLSGAMRDSVRAVLRAHLVEIPDTPGGRSERVRDAITLIVASPDYLIQM